MPSDKRARQRAMREIKLAEEQRRARRRKSLRRGLVALVVVGAVVGIVLGVSGSSPKKPSASKKAATTTTAAGTPTTAPVSTVKVAPTCPPAGGAAKRVIAFTKAPPICVARKGVYDAAVKTDAGSFTIQLRAASSLVGVNDFVFLARYHFYDGTTFLRVIKGFVVQGGSPTNTATGGPGYSFTGSTPAASCQAKGDCYPTGTVALANSGSPSSDGSQFFIVLPGGGASLSPNYTVIGTVVSGMSVVERIGADGAPSTDQTGTPKVLHHIDKVTVTQVS